MNLPRRPARSGAGMAKARPERDRAMGTGVGPVRAMVTINGLAVPVTAMDAGRVRGMAIINGRVDRAMATIAGLGPATAIGPDRATVEIVPMGRDKAMARRDRRRPRREHRSSGREKASRGSRRRRAWSVGIFAGGLDQVSRARVGSGSLPAGRGRGWSNVAMASAALAAGGLSRGISAVVAMVAEALRAIRRLRKGRRRRAQLRRRDRLRRDVALGPASARARHPSLPSASVLAEADSAPSNRHPRHAWICARGRRHKHLGGSKDRKILKALGGRRLLMASVRRRAGRTLASVRPWEDVRRCRRSNGLLDRRHLMAARDRKVRPRVPVDRIAKGRHHRPSKVRPVVGRVDARDPDAEDPKAGSVRRKARKDLARGRVRRGRRRIRSTTRTATQLKFRI